MLFPGKKSGDPIRRFTVPAALFLILAGLSAVIFFWHYIYFEHTEHGRQTILGETVLRVLRQGVLQTIGPAVDQLQAEPLPGRLEISLKWQPTRRSWRQQELFRSKRPLLTAADLKQAGLVARLPAGRNQFVDRVPSAGRWYYAVVIRNRYFRYPLMPGKNTLLSGVETDLPGLPAQFSLSVAGINRVAVNWRMSRDVKQAVLLRYQGGVVRSMAAGTVIKRTDRYEGSFIDRPGPGRWSYRLKPLTGTNRNRLLSGSTVTEQSAAIDGSGNVRLVQKNQPQFLPFSLEPAGRRGYFLLPGERVEDLLNSRLQQRIRAWAKGVLSSLDNLFPEQISSIVMVDSNRFIHSSDPRNRFGTRSSGYRPDRKNLLSLYTNRQTGWVNNNGKLQLFAPLTWDRYWGKLEVLPGENSNTGIAVTLFLFMLLFTACGWLYVRFISKLQRLAAVILVASFAFVTVFLTMSDISLQRRRLLSQIEQDSRILNGILEQSGLVKNEGKAAEILLPLLNKILLRHRLAASGNACHLNNEKRIVVDLETDIIQAPVRQGRVLVLLGVLAAVGLFPVVERSFRRAYLFRRSLVSRFWLLIVLPLLLIFTLVLLLPAVWFLLQMFFDNPSGNNPAKMFAVVRFSGWDSFTFWFGAGWERLAVLLQNTFLYVGGSVAGQGLAGLLLAYAIHAELRGRRFGKRLLLAPWAFPAFVSALIWHYLLYLPGGALQRLLAESGSEPVSALLLMAGVSVWYGTPFIMLATLEILERIPEELYEMARMDGVGLFQRLFRISLPIVFPRLLPVLGLSSLWTFNQFNLVYLFAGGDDRLDTVVTGLYDYIAAAPGGGIDSRSAGFAVLVMLLYSGYLILLRVRDPERTIYVLRGRP